MSPCPRVLFRFASSFVHKHTALDDFVQQAAETVVLRAHLGNELRHDFAVGELDFGPWEQIFYGEFDGRRRKRVLVKIIGE